MSVNGVTQYNAAAVNSYETVGKTQTEKPAASTSKEETVDSGVVYEPSAKEEVTTPKKTYKPNTALVNKMKADAEARTEQLKSLVEKLISGQGNAIGQSDNIWSFLRKGNFTVDAATKAQAQADIAEDGYWGVTQTSDRILDFAKALSGGNPDKIEELRNAFKKGFEQATKTWGDKLPDISQRTYDAVMEKFDAWAAEGKTPAAPEAPKEQA